MLAIYLAKTWTCPLLNQPAPKSRNIFPILRQRKIHLGFWGFVFWCGIIWRVHPKANGSSKSWPVASDLTHDLSGCWINVHSREIIKAFELMFELKFFFRKQYYMESFGVINRKQKQIETWILSNSFLSSQSQDDSRKGETWDVVAWWSYLSFKIMPYQSFYLYRVAKKKVEDQGYDDQIGSFHHILSPLLLWEVVFLLLSHTS